MLKIISSLLLLVVFSFADLKIFAKSAKEVKNIIYLDKPYLIYNDKFFIQSNKAVIKNKHNILFEGNVTLFYKNSVIKSNKVEVITKNNIKINYTFYYDKQLDVWIRSKISKYKNNVLYFNNLIFSSCCVKNPDWYLFAKKGSYNKNTKYLKLYNLILYVHKTPVFYLPFYFNSLNKKRRSGFLRPYVGFSAQEGFLYSQPIYFVTSLRSDLELTPTIRTKRGKGIYLTFRFVDSPYSFGEFKSGIFYDSNKYFTQNNLAHKKHFGYEFNYKRDKIFNNDKLYIDLKYANDVDYFYLNPKNYTFNQDYLTDKIITSKINYIKNFNNSILGIYNRYFIDTSLLNNKNTLQVLPQINYHIFEKKHKLLLTSFDYNLYNYYSEGGNRYFVSNFILPVGINLKLNDYMNFKISEILKGEYGNYYNSSIPPNYFFSTYSQFKLYSSFTKTGDFLHIISPEIIFNLKNYNKSKINSNIINANNMQNSLEFDIFQIFQKNDFYIDHSFHQFYNIDANKAENMENIINMNYKNFSLSDNNKFDWDRKRTVYNSAVFVYSFFKNKLYLTHVYQYEPKLKSIDIKFEKGINSYKKLYFEYNYDMINRYPKFWMFGINLNKKCWQYDFGFKKLLTPVLKENGVSYNEDYIISFNINFYPIGGIKQSILFK